VVLGVNRGSVFGRLVYGELCFEFVLCRGQMVADGGRFCEVTD
jgi:hypothetical protein